MWEAKTVLEDLSLAIKYCGQEMALISAAHTQFYLVTRPHSTLKRPRSTIISCFWSLGVRNIWQTTSVKIAFMLITILFPWGYISFFQNSRDYSKRGSMGSRESFSGQTWKVQRIIPTSQSSSVWLARSHDNAVETESLLRVYLGTIKSKHFLSLSMVKLHKNLQSLARISDWLSFNYSLKVEEKCWEKNWLFWGLP